MTYPDPRYYFEFGTQHEDDLFYRLALAVGFRPRRYRPPKPLWVPTRKQIAAGCLAIQAEWTAEEKCERLVASG